MTAVVFAHGLDSGPIGRKSQALLDAGFEVVAPDCRNRDLRSRVEILTTTLAELEAAPVLLGSSFGGIAGLLAAITSTHAGRPVRALFLCAPALQVPAPSDFPYPIAPPAPTVILHGVRDEVIPIDYSRRFAAEHGVELIEVDDDHALVGAVPTIVEVTRRLLTA